MCRVESSPSSSADILWEVTDEGPGQVGVEIWYSGSDTLEAEILDPDGQSLARVELGNEAWVEREDTPTLLLCVDHDRDRRNNDNRVALWLEGDGKKGDWCLRLHGATVADGAFHAWLGSTLEPGLARFAPPNDDAYTLGSLANGTGVIAVAAYDANNGACPICRFSSAGPTRDGREKPDLSAPGEAVHAARSGCSCCTVAISGTSMSAPAVAGVVAIMFAEARACGMNLSSAEIRDLLKTAARRAGAGWQPRYGWGRLDARAAVLAVHDLHRP